MKRYTMLHIRVDGKTKQQAADVLASMGLTLSDAVRMLLRRVVNDQALPLELKEPNAETRAAMEEARTLAQAARLHAGTVSIDEIKESNRVMTHQSLHSSDR